MLHYSMYAVFSTTLESTKVEIQSALEDEARAARPSIVRGEESDTKYRGTSKAADERREKRDRKRKD
jgi:hypothetical protein